jgi:hypothetical protein
MDELHKTEITRPLRRLFGHSPDIIREKLRLMKW